MKRTISARADGAVCIGREAVPVGVFLIKVCVHVCLKCACMIKVCVRACF